MFPSSALAGSNLVPFYVQCDISEVAMLKTKRDGGGEVSPARSRAQKGQALRARENDAEELSIVKQRQDWSKNGKRRFTIQQHDK